MPTIQKSKSLNNKKKAATKTENLTNSDNLKELINYELRNEIVLIKDFISRENNLEVLVIPISSTPSKNSDQNFDEIISISLKNIPLSEKVIKELDDCLKEFNCQLKDIIGKLAKLSGKSGDYIEYPLDAKKSIAFMGFGNLDKQDFKRAGIALGRKFKNTDVKSALIFPNMKIGLSNYNLKNQRKDNKVEKNSNGEANASLLFLNALALSIYQWKLSLSVSKIKFPKFVISGIEIPEQQIASTYYKFVWWARDLIQTPSNIKTPLWFAEQTKETIAKTKNKNLSCKELSGSELIRFGGLLAIGNSSPNPGPRVVQVTYQPQNISADTPHVVIVGKGITFDTGGISLKRPYEYMTQMKSDMSGAAAVMATVIACAELGAKVKVTALAMCAENALSSSSARPSDVIKQYDGQSVELINTDAEGRLVLADGIGYAIEKLSPDFLIDIATLTGSATLGLSRHYGALYSRDIELVNQLTACGEKVGERVWHMPLVDEYEISLESDIADMNHAADKYDFSAGSITAALFLEKFVVKSPRYEIHSKNNLKKSKNKALKWAHFDIAGPARSESDAGENVKGGTGFGVRILTNWITQL